MSKPVKLFAAVSIVVALAGAWWIVSGTIVGTQSDTQQATSLPKRKSRTDAAPNTVHVDAHARNQLGLAFGTAEVREIVKPVSVPGIVSFDDRRVTHLKPRTKGRVLTLAVEPGDVVEPGAVLATLDASGVLDAHNGLEGARASLGEAKATRDAALIAVTRAKALLKIGGIAKAELERRQVEAAKAEAAIQSAQAQADLYSAQYDRLAPARGAAPGTSEIVAPIKGVVISENITLGEVIDTTQDAFTVADPSKVLVLASLFGFDIDAVKKGDKAVIHAPVGTQADFGARVLSVNAALDPMTNAAAARIQVENPRHALRANMYVAVDIEANLGRHGVTIPAAAVQQTEQGPIAFVRTSEDTFVKRALTLGLQRTDWVEVVKGVSSGERVATEGSFGLKAMLLRSLLGSTD
ncbi:Efflux transporter periplasmic adaptor subunit (plasmid) [Beijerinckiaceae bacterium RH AL1]|nr:efflux RND transporter periplasmic adaptor subunit [Beijerinckiaceae bacterium]VVB50260.1 Efflux transporter periplasmic adaptor subunit [Beijerinckiaceae bacterium RH CH11]VVB50269.1 Efflux transporter periplasmic adaptor subunit [Beijerinckiaceae bacterium RH AL8]VVC57310.1 Efflux transporter periplasmic adaptor subunit [Beijerinckiaceae bacterium RH AL1]